MMSSLPFTKSAAQRRFLQEFLPDKSWAETRTNTAERAL
jgi:hypothetical protein